MLTRYAPVRTYELSHQCSKLHMFRPSFCEYQWLRVTFDWLDNFIQNGCKALTWGHADDIQIPKWIVPYPILKYDGFWISQLQGNQWAMRFHLVLTEIHFIIYIYRQISYISRKLEGNRFVGHSHVVRASPFRCCPNYIVILDLTLGFKELGKDNCKTREKYLSFGIWCDLY